MDIDEIERFAAESRKAQHVQTQLMAQQTLLLVETVRLLREIRNRSPNAPSGVAEDAGGDIAG